VELRQGGAARRCGSDAGRGWWKLAVRPAAAAGGSTRRRCHGDAREEEEEEIKEEEEDDPQMGQPSSSTARAPSWVAAPSGYVKINVDRAVSKGESREDLAAQLFVEMRGSIYLLLQFLVYLIRQLIEAIACIERPYRWQQTCASGVSTLPQTA
jgi:hypothetical protein